MKLKLRYLSLSVILIVSIVAIFNSLMGRLGIYSTFNWVIDYRFGFCKRGFLGTVFHIFLDIFGIEWNFINLNAYVTNIHIFVSILSLVVLLLLYIKTVKYYCKYKYILTYIFITLICSFFLKNIFYLTGYLDLWIFLIFLIILFSLLKHFYYFSVILGVIASLFTELSFVFWLPIFLSYSINKGINKEGLIFALPLISALLVHFSGIPVHQIRIFYSSFGDFSKFYAINYEEFLYGIYFLFKNQYNLTNYILERINFLAEQPIKIIISFIILGCITLFLFLITLFKIIKSKINPYKRITYFILSIISLFSPLLLLLVATDFYRFVGFCVFSSFIFIYCSIIFTDDDSLQDSVFLSHKNFKTVLNIGYLFSIFTLFMPPLTTQGTNYILFTKEVLKNIEISDPYILKPVSFSFDSLYSFFAHFTYDNNSSFKYQLLFNEKNVLICAKTGKSFVGESQSYGKTRITIRSHFAESDPDQFKFIRFMNKRIQVDRNVEESFDIYISDIESMKYPSVLAYIEPSSADWIIDKFEIVNISQE